MDGRVRPREFRVVRTCRTSPILPSTGAGQPIDTWNRFLCYKKVDLKATSKLRPPHASADGPLLSLRLQLIITVHLQLKEQPVCSMSLAEHLERLQNRKIRPTSTSRALVVPFPAGTQQLSIRDYVVNLSTKEAQYHPSVDTRSGQHLHCKIYKRQVFESFSPLFYRGIDGVRSALDVVKDEKLENVYVFYKISFGDLYDFWKERKRLSEGFAVCIFRQIVTLVKDAHENSVILRNINLKKFVFEDGEQTRLVLRDLDDAHLQEGGDKMTGSHTCCPPYISPEMLQGGSYSGKAADLWSLGVILYTLLVGHYPFFDTYPQNLFSKIRSGYYPMPENASLLAKSVITSLLVYDPSGRVHQMDGRII